MLLLKYFEIFTGLIIQADKTGNLYNVKQEDYHNLVNKELYKEYKICDKKRLNLINKEGLKIVQSYKLEDKTEPYIPNSPRISLKNK